MVRISIAFASLLAVIVTGYDSNDTYRATRKGVDLDSSAFRTVTRPDRKLSEVCEETAQCEAAFSQCKSGKCSCRRGFKASGNVCEAKRVRCPFGKKSGGLTNCELRLKRTDCTGPGCTFPPIPARSPPGRIRRQVGAEIMTTVVADQSAPQWQDDCPNGSFCLIHSAVIGDTSNAYKGHCCLKPKLNCPLGAPAKEYSCKQDRQSNLALCPSETHVCLTVQLNGLGMPSSADGICCPRPCREGHVYANNRCYAKAKPGQMCEVDEQCEQSGGVCKNGNCLCTKGTVNRGTRCERATCFAGIGRNRKPTSALVDNSGNVKECQTRSECGSIGYCESAGYCCQKPEPYCPNNPTGPLENPVMCDPLDRTGNTCPFGQVCLQYYPSSDGGEGVCCERTTVDGFR